MPVTFAKCVPSAQCRSANPPTCHHNNQELFRCKRAAYWSLSSAKEDARHVRDVGRRSFLEGRADVGVELDGNSHLPVREIRDLGPIAREPPAVAIARPPLGRPNLDAETVLCPFAAATPSGGVHSG